MISAGILMPYGDNGVLAISRNYSTVPTQVEAAVFREAAEGEAVSQEKIVLTFAMPYLINAVKTEVVAFNKANPDVRIGMKNYNGDYDRLYAEIVAGDGPDILALPSGWNLDELIAFAESFPAVK